MIKQKRNRKMALIIVIMLFALILVMKAFAASDISLQGKLYFTGIVGENPAGGNRVLLRWYSLEGTVPFDQYTLYRKEGDKTSASPYEKLTQIEPIRNINTIRTLFEIPGSEDILADIINILETVTGDTVTQDNYAELLIQYLDSQHPSGTVSLQNTTLANVNWGVAIVMGIGYVDPVGSGIQTYELHAVDESGSDSMVLGRITIDADSVTTLPPPENMVEADIPGPRGDRTIFLKWKNSAGLMARLPLSFGYDVYRLEGSPGGGDTFESLLAGGQLTKVNETPVIITGVPEGFDPTEHYDFADNGQTLGTTGPEGFKFEVGQVLTYWAVARDLFGQRGHESDAIIVVVPDQWPPAVPQDVLCSEDRSTGVKRSKLIWTRNADDTVEYNVYRSRLFQHAGQKGPFPNEDGLVEGKVAVVAQPVSGATVELLEIEIDGVNQENMAYWYNVLAVDAWGNESGMSVPVRCVLFDTDAPSAPKPRVFCYEVFRCSSNSVIVTNEIRPIQVGREIELRFKRLTPDIRRIRVFRLVNDDPAVWIAELEFADALINEVSYTDIPPVVRGDTLNYRFQYFTVADRKPRCESELSPEIVKSLKSYISHYVPIQTTIGRVIGQGRICTEIDFPRRIPVDPTLDGIPNPLCFQFAPYEDVVGIMLYRSDNGDDYFPIDELEFPEGGGNLEICDEFNPDTPVQIRYGFKAFDENGNLSPLYRFQPTFLFPGRSPALIPVVKKVESTGDVANPSALVTWFGPKAGVASYIVRFKTPEYDNDVYRPVSALFYDEEKSLFSLSLDNINDETPTSIALNQVYEVMVFARLYDGSKVPSSNKKKFVWTNIILPDEPLDWPVRPLPPKSPVLNVTGFSSELGVMILLGQYYAPEGQGRPPLLDIVAYDLPFMFYRQRTDLENQPYIQISPLFEEINVEGSTLNDPFFYHAHYNFGAGTFDAIYYIDNVGLVDDAKYRYQLLTLDATGELQAVFGPSNEVTIEEPKVLPMNKGE